MMSSITSHQALHAVETSCCWQSHGEDSSSKAPTLPVARSSSGHYLPPP